MSVFNWLNKALYQLIQHRADSVVVTARFLGTLECAPSQMHHASGDDAFFCAFSDYLIFSDTLYTEKLTEFEGVQHNIKPLKASKSYLGTSTDNIIFDARQSFPLDYIACLVGTMSHQGCLIILLDSDASQDHDSMRFMGHLDATPNFKAWLTLTFKQHAWRFEDAKWQAPVSVAQRDSVYQAPTRTVDRHGFIPITFEDPALLTAHPHPNHLPYVSASGLTYLSPRSISKSFGYTTAQAAIFWQLSEITMQIFIDSTPSMCTLFSDRGTGKSYLIHHFLIYLKSKQIPFFLTAPNQQALSSYDNTPYYAFDYLLNELRSNKSNHDSAGKPIPKNAWLLIEECAVLPLKVVIALSEYFKAVLLISSTNEYEGVGRGLVMKLHQHLSLTHAFHLDHALRFDDQDSVQTWLNCLLFKTAVQTDVRHLVEGHTDKAHSVEYLAEATLAQWRQDINSVRAFYQLLYQSHYQTNAQDIRRLWDDPSTVLVTTQSQVGLAGGIWGLQEGKLSSELAQAVYEGRRRPFGNLAVQTLSAHGYFEAWMQLKSVRVSRIFVANESRQQGIATAMIQTLVTHLTQASLTKNCDFISVSFGLTADLLAFWLKQAFIWVHVSSSRDKSSGLHSAVMIRPLSDKAKLLCSAAQTQFLNDIPILANAPFIAQNTGNMLQTYRLKVLPRDDLNLSAGVDTSYTNLDDKMLNAFVHHYKPFEACFCAIARVAASDPRVAVHLKQVVADENAHQRKSNIELLKQALAGCVALSDSAQKPR